MLDQPSLPPKLQARIDKARDIESRMLQLAADLRYPVDANGNVLDMNHLPDVLTTLAYHLIRCGWEKNPDKQLIKQRPVRGGGYYEDLVAYVGVNESDEPIVIDPSPVPEVWSVKPTVNMIDEERPDE